MSKAEAIANIESITEELGLIQDAVDNCHCALAAALKQLNNWNPADINDDGIVGSADLSQVAANWGKTAPSDA